MGHVFPGICSKKEMHFLPITTFMKTYPAYARGIPMNLPARPRIALTIRVKILVLFLALSLAALAITGYFAFSAITDVGSYAQGSSQALGSGVVNDSSAALLSLGEQYLVRIASRPGNITDVLFEDTDTEMDILSAQTAELQRNPPVISSTPVYPETIPRQIPCTGRCSILCPDRQRQRNQKRHAPSQAWLMA